MIGKGKKKSVREKAPKYKTVSVTVKTHQDNNEGHPHVIMENIGNRHVSVGLTTQKKKGRGKKSGNNYPMEKSVFDDGKDAYMRRQGTVDLKKNYSGKRQGTLTEKDYEQAKIYAERAKQKYSAHVKKKK